MAEDSEGMHHRQQLEDVGGLDPLGSCELTAFKGERMMHPVVVRQCFNPSKLACSGEPQAQVACGPQRRVNGAAMSE